jgi:hypothetical protein
MSEHPREPRIFLSYARKDSTNVKELYRKLTEAGYHPWMDVEDILPGEDWEKKITTAIQEVPFFLACLSTNSVDHRGVVQQEIKEALQVWRRKLDDDIYLIPVRLDNCRIPDALTKFNWVDLFEDKGFSRLLKAIREQMDRMGYFPKIRLRSVSSTLSKSDTEKMLREHDFFEPDLNWMGKGIRHQYEMIDQHGRELVIDYTTGLTWQQSGSESEMTFDMAERYVRHLNEQHFAGCDDWRLPTLEEAMSLVEPKMQAHRFHIDSLFSTEQTEIWTTDQNADGEAWGINFAWGFCFEEPKTRVNHVRAVRSGQIDE